MHNALLGVGLLGLTAFPYRIYDMAQFMLWVAGVAMILMMLQVWLIRARFAHSSFGYLVFSNFLATGIIGTALCSYAFLFYANAKYDGSVPQVRKQHVLESYTTQRKRSTVYHVKFADWHNADVIDVTVGRDIYDRAQHSPLVTVRTHAGALGFEWYEVL